MFLRLLVFRHTISIFYLSNRALAMGKNAHYCLQVFPAYIGKERNKERNKQTNGEKKKENGKNERHRRKQKVRKR